MEFSILEICCTHIQCLSLYILISAVDEGMPFNMRIVVDLISSFCIVEHAEEPPNKSVFQADIPYFAVHDLAT